LFLTVFDLQSVFNNVENGLLFRDYTTFGDVFGLSKQRIVATEGDFYDTRHF